MSDYEAADLIRAGATLGRAGLTPGTTGNLSAIVDDGILVTATGARLGYLGAHEVAKIDREGRHVSGSAATKEVPLHVAIYQARADVAAVVHLHSPAALAVSCLAELQVEDPLPVYTPYYAMRVGTVHTLDYFPPGDGRLADATARSVARGADALILRNHGLVCVAGTLASAVAAAEELEANCELHLRLAGFQARTLQPDDVEHLRRRWRDR